MPVTSHAHVVAGGVLDGKSAATLAAPPTPQITSIMQSPQSIYIAPAPVRSAPPVPEIPAAFREKARQQLEARQQRISSSTDETEENSDDDLYVPGGFMQPGVKYPVQPQEKGYLSTAGIRTTHPALRKDRERDSGDDDDDDRSIYSCTTSGRGRTMLLEKEPPMPGGMVMI